MKAKFTMLLFSICTIGLSQVTVIENQNVGVGTETPVAKLQIVEESNGPALEITKPRYSNSNIRFSSTEPNLSYSQISADGHQNQAIYIELDKSGLSTFDQFKINKDGNTNLYYIDSADEQHWYVEGIEKMTMKKTGYFGIGTTDPLALLHVNGTGRIKDWVFWQTNTGASYLENYGSESMTIRNTAVNKNVSFQSRTSAGYYSFLLNSPSGNYTLLQGYKVGINGIGQTGTPTATFHIKSDNVNDAVKIWDHAGNTLFQMKKNGYVGLGTSSPNSKLHIDDYSPVITLRRNTNSGGYTQGIQTKLQDGTPNWFYGNHGGNFVLSRGAYNTDQVFKITPGTNTQAAFSCQLKIDLPSYANATTNAPVEISNNKGAVSMFLGKYENTSSYLVNESSGDIRFNGSQVAWGDLAYYPNGDINGGGFGHFRFSRAGSSINTTPSGKLGVGNIYVHEKVGINTTAPSADLDVNGTAEISGKLTLNNVLNLQPLSNAPQPANTGDIYIDDGTVNNNGDVKLRYYNGSTWVNL